MSKFKADSLKAQRVFIGEYIDNDSDADQKINKPTYSTKLYHFRYKTTVVVTYTSGYEKTIVLYRYANSPEHAESIITAMVTKLWDHIKTYKIVEMEEISND